MKTFIWILILLISCLTAVAQTTGKPPGSSPRLPLLAGLGPDDTAPPAMKLEEMIEELKTHNPQIEQARKNYLAAKTVAPQLLAPNNPQIGFVNNPITGNPLNMGQSQGFYYTLTESFPFPGKKRLPAKIADDQAEILKNQIEYLSLQLTAQLRFNFFQLLLLRHQHDINEESVRRMEQIKEITKIRYSQNAAAFVDYLNSQVAENSAKNDQFALEKEIDTLRQTLNTLIGRDPGSPLEIHRETPEQTLVEKPLSELETLAIENNPSVKISFLQIEAAKKGMDLAKLDYYPDFNLILYFNSTNPPIGVTDVNTYGTELDMTFPLIFFQKEKFGVEQAKANLEASQANDKSMRQQIILAVDTAYNQFYKALNQSNFIRSNPLLEAKTAYRLALANYGNGSSAFIDLLTAQNNLRNTELALSQSEISVLQSYANLAAAVGSGESL